MGRPAWCSRTSRLARRLACRLCRVWLPGLGELDHEAVYALALRLAPCEERERLREQLAVGELVGVPAKGGV